MKTLIILFLAALAALAQNVPPGGSKPTLVSVDGTSYSAAPKIYIAPGTGVTNSLSCANGVCTVTVNSLAGGVSAGTSLPATCTAGTPFVKTDASPNTAQLYICGAGNSWAQQTGGSGDVTGGTSLTTAGAIPYVSASGTLSQDQTSGGQLYWDSTNHRACFGTTSCTARMTIVGESLTGSAATSAVDITQTWNTSGSPSALKVNVTNTASGASAKLLELQVGGSTAMYVDKVGAIKGYSVCSTSATCLGANGSISLDGNEAVNWGGRTLLYGDVNNTLSIRNSTNAQAFRIYNTYTSASNYERAAFKWGSNLFTIGTEAETGTKRNMAIDAPTVTFQDATETTGATNVVIKAGAGQGTTKLLDVQTSAGATKFYVDAAGYPAINSASYGASYNVALVDYGTTPHWTFYNSTTPTVGIGRNGVIGTQKLVAGSSTLGGTNDIGLWRSAAGVFEINNGETAGALRDLKLRNISATSSIDGAHTVNLTDATTTTIFTVAMADGAMVGGQIHYTIYATDGTDHQVHSGVATYAGVRKGATYTLAINEAAQLETPALSTGALQDTFAFTAGTNSAVVTMNADTSLTPTTFKITYTITNNTGSTITYP